MIKEIGKKVALVATSAFSFLVVGVGSAFAAYSATTTEELIGDSIETIGDGIYTSAATILTAILPYAVGLVCIFLAVAMALRWMRRSVG